MTSSKSKRSGGGGEEEYRRLLEEELERLTQELEEIRLEKSKQRQRVQLLQKEQLQLSHQVSDEQDHQQLKSSLLQQMNSLQQVVQTKSKEHAKVQQEWERSQEQYLQLNRTVGLLQGSSALTGLLQEEEKEGEDDSSSPDPPPREETHPPSTTSPSATNVAGQPATRSGSWTNWIEGNLGNEEARARRSSAKSMEGDEGPRRGSKDFHPSQYLWEEDASIDDSTLVSQRTRDSIQMYKAQARKQKSEQEQQRTSSQGSLAAHLDNAGSPKRGSGKSVVSSGRRSIVDSIISGLGDESQPATEN